MSDFLNQKVKRFSPIHPTAVSEFTAYVANTPMLTHEDLVRKAIEMGYDPTDLIDASLGHVKYEKSSASLQNNLEDILNSVYEDDPTPGKRYVIDPSEAISKRGKEVAKSLEGNLGVASSLNIGRSRNLPDYAAVKQQYTDLKKLQAIAHAGHELQHQSDVLIRPNLVTKHKDAYNKGHHYGDIYESSELIREAKDLPRNQKELDEIVKQSKKAGLKPSSFQRLLGMLNPLAMLSQGVSALADIKEGKPNTAAAKLATSFAPMGAGQLEDNLMEEAAIKDAYPKLQDPTYLRTIKNIGERRQRMGKSPVVEGFDNEKIDTSQTENSVFENLMKKLREEKSRG